MESYRPFSLDNRSLRKELTEGGNFFKRYIAPVMSEEFQDGDTGSENSYHSPPPIKDNLGNWGLDEPGDEELEQKGEELLRTLRKELNETKALSTVITLKSKDIPVEDISQEPIDHHILIPGRYRVSETKSLNEVFNTFKEDLRIRKDLRLQKEGYKPVIFKPVFELTSFHNIQEFVKLIILDGLKPLMDEGLIAGPVFVIKSGRTFLLENDYEISELVRDKNRINPVEMRDVSTQTDYSTKETHPMNYADSETNTRSTREEHIQVHSPSVIQGVCPPEEVLAENIIVKALLNSGIKLKYRRDETRLKILRANKDGITIDLLREFRCYKGSNKDTLVEILSEIL